MAFELSEDYDFNFSQHGSPGTIDKAAVESCLKEFAGPVSTSSFPAPIFPQFHVLSADKVTHNKTLYTYASHKGKNEGEQPTGQHSFTKPYFIPLIEEHRTTDGAAGPASQVFGRMISAKLIKNKESGKAHVAGLGQVSDPKAIHELLTGLWLTGSLGSIVQAAHCSVCNEQVLSSYDFHNHMHQRGAYYKTASPKEQGEVDPLGYVQCTAKEKNAQLCYTAVDSYRAAEYSKVITPSDYSSLVMNPNIAVNVSSDFATPALESFVPTTRLWVPMAQSSSRDVSEWGERYIDVISGQEVASASVGLLSGLQLNEYVEAEKSSFSEAIWTPAKVQSLLLLPLLAESSFTEAPLPAVLKTPYTPFYCGENKSYPASTLSEYRASLRLLEKRNPSDKSQIKTRLLRAGRKAGWSPKV